MSRQPARLARRDAGELYTRFGAAYRHDLMDTSLALVVVAKLPVAGNVKTRLFARFTPAAAAMLHELLLLHTVNRLDSLKLGTVLVLFDPPDQADAFRVYFDEKVELVPQSSGNLGDRITAAADLLRKRFEHVLFVGCDSPDVPDSHISAAIQSLDTAQLALAPTEDGGFWSIGFDRSVDVRSLLNGVPWSSGRECEAVLEKAASLHLDVRVCGRWTDVDHPSDVDALLWRLEHSQAPADRRLFLQLERIVSPNDRTVSPAKSPSHA